MICEGGVVAQIFARISNHKQGGEQITNTIFIVANVLTLLVNICKINNSYRKLNTLLSICVL